MQIHYKKWIIDFFLYVLATTKVSTEFKVQQVSKEIMCLGWGEKNLKSFNQLLINQFIFVNQNILIHIFCLRINQKLIVNLVNDLNYVLHPRYVKKTTKNKFCTIRINQINLHIKTRLLKVSCLKKRLTNYINIFKNLF